MEFINIGDVRHTPISREIVELAAKHTAVSVKYEHLGEGHSKADILIKNIFDDTTIGAFWEEFDRLQRLIKNPLNEHILPDDYPLVQGDIYVANGKPRVFIDGERMTVGAWKRLHIDGVEDVTEVRNCDVYGRALRRPQKVEVSTTLAQAMKNAPSKSKPKRRKGHKTFKIKRMA